MVTAPTTNFETALNLISAIDCRSPYYAGRTRALVAICRGAAEPLGLHPGELQRLEWAAVYCDLGMLSLPDALVLKAGPLTISEMQQVRGHVNLSLQLIADNPPPVPVADIVAAHHERYDGSGYPRGLRGYEVPLLANVLQMADTLVALTSDRPHRRGFDASVIAEIVTGERGKQFYPEVVDAVESMDLSQHLAQRRPTMPVARQLHLHLPTGT